MAAEEAVVALQRKMPRGLLRKRPKKNRTSEKKYSLWPLKGYVIVEYSFYLDRKFVL